MEELKLKQSSQEETGFGLLSGCSQLTMSMEPGQYLEKSISWNPGEMLNLTLLEESISLPQLFTGDLTGHRTNILRLMLSTPTQQDWMIPSTPMDSTGMRTDSTPTLMIHLMLSLMLISLLNPSGKEVNSHLPCKILGLVKTTLHHSIENSI